jgi:RNA polymerase sigma factor (sigma-70 family)
MNNYKESDYAKNKLSQNIVYQTSNGTFEITIKQYLQENPSRDEEDFRKLKDFSDEVYRQQAKEEHTQTNRNARFDENIESGFFYFPSPEEILIAREERMMEQKFIDELLFVLTPSQRKRLLLHTVEGLSYKEIAEQEGISPSAIRNSIVVAKSKLRDRLWT